MSERRVALGEVGGQPAFAEIHAQCIGVEEKKTKGGKPFVSLTWADGATTITQSVWSDAPEIGEARGLQKGQCYALRGHFSRNDFGLESRSWLVRPLEPDETAIVFQGPPAHREKQAVDWAALTAIVAGLPEGSLKTLTQILLTDHEQPFRRAAAARGNHHARRGGLVEHVSLMAQSAQAMCGVYGELRGDLLIAAVVFHDCGKMVENQYEPQGFEMPFSFKAEAYGHILIGIEMARKLWQTLPPEAQKADDLLLHALCHCIAAHHGCAEWGSPVDPKLPEAAALHYLDNLDAKLEMMRAGTQGPEIAPGVHERHYTLKVNLLKLP